MAKANDKKALLAALKPKTHDHTIEGFGKVGITQLSIGEVEKLRELAKKEGKLDKFAYLLTIRCVVDEEGNPFFGDDDLTDLEAGSNDVMEALVGRVFDLHGYGKKAAEKN